MALVAATTGSAHADSDDIPTAVLGLETQDVPSKLGDEIADYLRQNVSNSHDYRLVSGKDLVELKLVFSCADESHTCMGLAGKSLDAGRLIYGSVKRSGENYVVWLKLFDVQKEKIDSWLSESLPKDKSTGAPLKATVGRWYARLRGRPTDVGTLRISADLTGAVVNLDGVPVGATTEKPLVLSDVATGKHVLMVEKAGRPSASKSVTLTSAQVLEVPFTLQGRSVTAKDDDRQRADRSAPPVVALRAEDEDTAAKDPSSARSGSAYRVGFWVTLAAAAFSGGAAVKYGLDVSRVNKDLDPFRRYEKCPAGVTPPCDGTGSPKAPLTTAESSAVNKLTSEGDHAHRMQWVTIGAGSALGIASAYLLYKGYLDSDDHDGAHESVTSHNGLRIFPTADASRGGIVAEFDF